MVTQHQQYLVTLEKLEICKQTVERKTRVLGPGLGERYSKSRDENLNECDTHGNAE